MDDLDALLAQRAQAPAQPDSLDAMLSSRAQGAGQNYAQALKDFQAQNLAEMGTTGRALAGIGSGAMDLFTGLKQRLGMESQAQVDEQKRLNAPLMGTTAGSVGNIGGQALAALPAAFVPGANTVLGAAALSGLSGALQPTAQGESAAKNALSYAALGGGAQFGLGKLASGAQSLLSSAEQKGASLASQNAVRDATLANAQGAGYVVPPSMANGGLTSRLLEGLSGKYKTNQLASIKNQGVTDALARQAVGLDPSAPLTSEAMQAIRNKAFQDGYAPVASAGPMETDRLYMGALDNIGANYQGAARSFPNAVPPDVLNKTASLKTGAMDPGDALKMSQILRDQASQSFAAGDKGLAKASLQASKAIEDQVERGLEAAGENAKPMLDAFRNARALMAKSHTVEDAIREGGGVVDAKALGRAFQAGEPLSGPLKTIGAFANNFGDVAGVPKAGWANPITVMDAFGSTGMVGMGAGPYALALPAARVAARYGILSAPYQRAFLGTPDYGPGLLARAAPKALSAAERRALGGLLAPALVDAAQ